MRLLSALLRWMSSDLLQPVLFSALITRSSLSVRMGNSKSLDEGPNLIEIMASDNNGNETSLILAVIYEP
jgi:hypothetical protein